MKRMTVNRLVDRLVKDDEPLDAYREGVRDLSPALRLEALDSLVAAVKRGDCEAAALEVPIRAEQDLLVCGAAARALAVYEGERQHDLLAGVRRLVEMFDEADLLDRLQKVGVISAILDFGDERVLPLIDGRWRDLDAQEGAAAACECSMGLATTARMTFLLDYLNDDADEETVREMANVLEAMPSLGSPGVVRVRHFIAGGKDPETLVDAMSFADYAAEVDGRLEPIERLLGPETRARVVAAWRASKRSLAPMFEAMRATEAVKQPKGFHGN